MDVPTNLKAMARLRRLGIGGYVVMTPEAGKAGLDTRFPLGEIVALSDTFTVVVRKVGQRSTGKFAAAFWQPMPNRLIGHLR